MAELLTALINFFTEILKWCLDGVLFILKTIIFSVVDGFLTVITTFFSLIDLSAVLSNIVLDWAGLPGAMIYVVNAVSIPQCLTIIAAAIGIRMLINLIPAAFTRI